VESLTVPVHAKNNIKYNIVGVDHSQNWIRIHLRTIKSAYSNAPYFDHYFPLIEEILQKEIQLLTDVNLEILTLCLRLLGWDKKVSICKVVEIGEEKDYRNRVSLRKNVGILESIFQERTYQQLFGSKFVPNLSILDLLFNEGTQASDYFSEDAYNKLIKRVGLTNI
jgi:hypothetical protein